MFFKIILFSITLWQHFSFSSVQDTKKLQDCDGRKVFSLFYANISKMKTILNLKISYFKPHPFIPTLEIPKQKRDFIKQYMRRFHCLKTNFQYIDSIIKTISNKNNEIKTDYANIQSIDWEKLDITYQELNTNIEKLISFYEKYKTEISENGACFTPTENQAPPLSDLGKKNTKKNQKTFFTQISQLKLYVGSHMSLLFKKATLYFRYIIRLLYR